MSNMKKINKNIKYLKNIEIKEKNNIQKDILKKLGKKPAISMLSIKGDKNPKKNYAISRSIKNLINIGYVEEHNSDNQTFLKLTKKGQGKLNCLKLEGDNALVNTSWDGFFRIIILDLEENRKSQREALRYLLKKAKFICIKNTVWISLLPYENLFMNIKKDLNLTTELMIIVTDKIDEETKISFLENLKK